MSFGKSFWCVNTIPTVNSTDPWEKAGSRLFLVTFSEFNHLNR